MKKTIIKNYNKKYFLRNSSIILGVSVLAVSLLSASPHLTEAAFTDQIASTVTSKADVLLPATAVKVTNTRPGETDLVWIASGSSYATGYKISRSTAIAGPWTQIGAVSGRATIKYTDTNSGTKSYFYKIDTVYKNWLSSVTTFVAPPVVGRTFFDSFNGPIGNLDGRTTEDGKSKWLVWSGTMKTNDVNPNNKPNVPNGFGAYGTDGIATTTPSPGLGDVAVVRTPTNDAWVYAEDFDGYERVILRGKDPQNYVYAGAATSEDASGNTTLVPGSFEIAEIKNGIKTVLDHKIAGADRNFRVEIKGNTIKAYVDAVSNNPTSGTLYMSVNSTFQQTDPSARYFGIGFTRGGMGINDFTFEAY